MSTTGGILGIVVGVVTSFLIAAYGSWQPVISPGAIMMSFAFASMVGVFFGIYPAWKAARSDVIEALRYE